MSLALIGRVYSSLLTPVPPFTWFGLSLSTLDVLATVRLCTVMRQIREAIHRGHEGKREERSFLRNFCATIVVVYGGEAITAPWLHLTPSFLLSPTYPLLYLTTQALVDSLPQIPPMSFLTEGPLTFLDALSRSWLLTDLLPPTVLKHTNTAVSSSPWILIIVSFIVANGGFFLVNLFSMLHPGGWSVTTPPELKSDGWTTVDLWAAPLVTGLFALLTHAQPFWTSVRLTLLGVTRHIDAGSLQSDPVKPWGSEDVRSLGALVLWVLFATRTINNFGIAWWRTRAPKKEVMRSRIDGRRYPGTTKKKTQ